jgi:hypothetical protein
MYYFEEEIGRATKAAGLRGVLGETIIQFPVPDAKTPAESLARTERFAKEFAGDDLITPAVAPHAMYTLDADTLKACRALADRLPEGYLTKISDGRTYGEALLDPSVIYVRFIQAAQQAGLKIHYAAHITGHGWRKIMRLEEPFVYQINVVPKPLEVFKFLIEKGPISAREAYATFNMGIGFAVLVDPADAQKILAIAAQFGHHANQIGIVRKDGNRKAVEIKPLNMTFEGETLNLR